MCIICCDSPNQSDLDQIVYLDCSGCKKVKVLPPQLPNLKFLSIYKTKIPMIGMRVSHVGVCCV